MKSRHRIIYTVSVLLFFTLVYSVFAIDESNPLIRIDDRIFDAIYDTPPKAPFLGHVIEAVTELGDGQTMMGISLLLVAFGDDQQFETGKLMTSAFIGTGVTIYILKQAVQRARPLEEVSGDPSFPSGHTGFAFATATILGCQYPRFKIPLYLGATLVGISRIYLGRHYPSDVFIGAAIGTLTAATVVRHEKFIVKWHF